MLRRLGVPDHYGQLLLDIRDATIPPFLYDKVFSVVGDEPTTLAAGEDTLVMGVLVEFESFRIRTGDQLPRTVEFDPTIQGLRVTTGVHGYGPVDGPVPISTTGTLPGGLASGTLYFIHVIDDTNFELHTTRESAEVGSAGPGRVTVLTSGAGTHTAGGFPDEVTETDSTFGNGTVTINAGTGMGTSQVLPMFQPFQARTMTVKGETANSRLKCVVI